MTDDETDFETVEDPLASNAPCSANPLVEVAFQRTPHQKHKFLESQPKALGITLIALGMFHIGFIIVMMTNGMGWFQREMLQIFGSHLVITAGCLALAAQNLRISMLKACLGMQVVACVVSGFHLLCTAGMYTPSHITSMCWGSDHNNTFHLDVCYSIMDSSRRYIQISAFVHTAVIAISVTLATYCCKVIACCSPTPRMPVITVQAPPAP